jgi:hypothetical protein
MHFCLHAKAFGEFWYVYNGRADQAGLHVNGIKAVLRVAGKAESNKMYRCAKVLFSVTSHVSLAPKFDSLCGDKRNPRKTHVRRCNSFCLHSDADG